VQEGGPIEVGDPAPEITLQATQVERVLPRKKDLTTLSLRDFKGKKIVVLFFFPRAMTSGCTVESCGFRDIAREFDAVGAVVLGASSDKLERQVKFTEKEGLNFPLLADPEKQLITALGVDHRMSFVFDKKGKLVKIFDKVNTKTHPDEVLTWIKENLL